MHTAPLLQQYCVAPLLQQYCVHKQKRVCRVLLQQYCVHKQKRVCRALPPLKAGARTR